MTSARAWPAERLPFSIIALTSSGKFISRSVLVMWLRLLPTAWASASWVWLNSSIRRRYARASSIAVRSSRWMFSTSAISKASRSPSSRSTTGNFVELRALRRAPAPLAGQDLESVGIVRAAPHQNGLQNALRAHRFDQRLHALLVEIAARLEAAGMQQLDRHAAQRSWPVGRPASLAQQRGQARGRGRGLRVSSVAHTSRPDPFARRRRSRAQQLAREMHIGLRAGAAEIIEQHRLAMRRRFGDAHIARDHGVVDLVAEMLRTSAATSVGQIVALVEHGQHHALHLERRD